MGATNGCYVDAGAIVCSAKWYLDLVGKTEIGFDLEIRKIGSHKIPSQCGKVDSSPPMILTEFICSSISSE